jgi:ATP synthase protein I
VLYYWKAKKYLIKSLEEINMNKKDNKDVLKNLALISQIGISIITPILLGVYLGNFIDKRLGTNGVFAIILIIIGAAAGFLNIFKLTGNNKRK